MLKHHRFLAATLCTALALCATATTAQAATLLEGSTLNFAGQSTCSSTGCTFGNAIATGGTGSFSSFTFGTLASFFPISFGSFTPGMTYSITNGGGAIASFFSTARTSESISQQNGLTNYTINDSGYASFTGFDDTPGFFLFTANQSGAVLGSFSATSVITSAAPEPGTWIMMIVGFGIVGASLRRRQRTAPRSAFGSAVPA